MSEYNIDLNIPMPKDYLGMSGVGATLEGSYILPFAPYLHVNGDIDYHDVTFLRTPNHLTLASIGLGIGPNVTLFKKLQLGLSASGGLFSGNYTYELNGGTNGEGKFSLYYSFDASAKFAILPNLSLGIGASIFDYALDTGPLFKGYKYSFGIAFSPTLPKHKPLLEIEELRIDPIFPILYKYYDTHPVGSITIKNLEKQAIGGLRVNLLLKDYMDSPKLCAVIPTLARGEEREVPLYAILKRSILDLREGSKANVSVKLDYNLGDAPISVERTASVRLYDRNAIAWDDDRKVGAFITAKDPAVMQFSKAISGLVREDSSPVASREFRIAMGLFQGLGTYGMRYVVDPQSAYADLADQKGAIDYLQLPSQSLELHGGDCDDLTALYCALLESVGIDSAIITIPGHIYMAICPNLDSRTASDFFSNEGDFLSSKGRLWIPVEITMVKDGFLAAWKEGAKEWRANRDSGRFYSTEDAWKAYESVDSPPGAGQLTSFGEEAAMASYRKELDRYISQELGPREKALFAEAKVAQGSPASSNKLGVLYARFGLFEKAKDFFEKALERGEYAPAFVNLGNLSFMGKDREGAAGYYERAWALKPGDASIALCLARLAYDGEDYEAARSYYMKVSALDPELALRFSYLAEKASMAMRAGSAGDRLAVEWSEEL